MGLFDFVKDAGAKILDSAGDVADALRGHVEKEVPDADSKNVEMIWRDGTVAVSGKARSQEEKEKIILAAGNVAGVEKIDDAIEVEGTAAQSRMYTVKSGDTLSGIAKEMYGDAGQYPKIFEANKPMLKDPDKIYPGQVLRIP